MNATANAQTTENVKHNAYTLGRLFFQRSGNVKKAHSLISVHGRRAARPQAHLQTVA